MASTKIPAPAHWLVKVYLIAALPVIAMLVILGVLAAARFGEPATAARMLVLALAVAGGLPYSWRRLRGR
jgi:hypothetical protein